MVPRQRLGADRTGAQFQHGGKAARGLSIVLQGGQEGEDMEEKDIKGQLLFGIKL